MRPVASIEIFCEEKIAELRARGRFKSPYQSARVDDLHIEVDGVRYLSFSSNDYLGLASDERVINAGIEALKEYGSSASSSRFITGNFGLYAELEGEIAGLYGAEDACVFSSGYAANIGVIPLFVGRGDLVVIDKLSHSCIYEACALSGAKLLRFKHNDYDNLEELLEKYRGNYERCLIVSEAVFSMDGDLCNIARVNEIAEKYDAFTMMDYAHFQSSVGRVQGSGLPDIVMGTFSKGFASLGGYVVGAERVIEYVRASAKSLIYSTALPPAVLASSIEAVRVVRAEPELAERGLENARYFAEKLGLAEAESQIVPLVIGGNDDCLKASRKLASHGFWVHSVKPPTVPENTARLRFSFSAKHTKEQIDRLVDVVKREVL